MESRIDFAEGNYRQRKEGEGGSFSLPHLPSRLYNCRHRQRYRRAERKDTSIDNRPPLLIRQLINYIIFSRLKLKTGYKRREHFKHLTQIEESNLLLSLCIKCRIVKVSVFYQISLCKEKINVF